MNKTANNICIDLVNMAEDAMEEISKATTRIIEKKGPEHKDLKSLADLHDYLRKHSDLAIRLIAKHKGRDRYQKMRR